MNALIKQTLEEHATDGPTPYVDVAAIESVGRQRVRRRRVASGVGALAALAALGVATPYVVSQAGGSQEGQVAVDGGASNAQVSWSVGTTVHLGDETVELPTVPRAYVLTDDGIVWTDAEQGVNLTVGGRTEQIGVSTVESGRTLVAEGSLVAWYDGNEQAFTVVDTSTARLVRQVPVVLDGPQDGEFDGPSVRALSDGVLWFYADREVTGVDVASAEVVETSGAGSSEMLADVRAGRSALAFSDDGPAEDELAKERVLVETLRGDDVGSVPGRERALLSPDGQYVVTDANDSEQVWDVATGDDVTPDFGYDFQAVVRWLDTDTYQALALDVVETPDGQADGPVDFLVCSVSSGQCELVADDALTFDSGEPFGIPIGESVS